MSDDHDLLIRMDEKLDHLSTQFVVHVTLEGTERAKLDIRVAKLEEWKWRWVGAVAVLVLVLTFVGNTAARFIVP